MAGTTKLTKAQFVTALAEGAGLDKKMAGHVLDALAALVKKQLSSGGPGEITIPNVVRLKAKASPATTDRQGVDPFTKQPKLLKGKPASLKVRATPVKALKDALSS